MRITRLTQGGKDWISLGMCWVTALGTATAIFRGSEWITLFLIGSALLWLGAATWVGGWMIGFRLPMAQFHALIHGPGKGSVLALPMLRASLILLLQGFLEPVYRLLT